MASDPLAVLRELVDAATNASNENSSLSSMTRLDGAIEAARAVLEGAEAVTNRECVGCTFVLGESVYDDGYRSVIAFKEPR